MTESTKDVIECFDRFLTRYFNMFPEASGPEVEKFFLSFWSEYQGYKPKFYIDQVEWDLVSSHYREATNDIL